MANKDHSLDSKIIDAAKSEFLLHGFRNASLHKICQNAEITTGALYTRYKNKDALFLSLVQNFISEVSQNLGPIRDLYMEVQKDPSAEKLLSAIRTEEKIYLDLMFKHYDECILFFCRSEGSSIEETIKAMMKSKACETVSYLKSISKNGTDLDGVEFLMSEQFHYYRQILEKGYSKEKAVSCMETIMLFIEAGWKKIFNTILEKEED